MKHGNRTGTRKTPSEFRTLPAVFAVLLNTIFAAGGPLAVAAPDTSTVDYVLCLASGGPMPASPEQKAPTGPDRDNPHCQQCRPPGPKSVHIPPPVAASAPDRIVVPVRHAAAHWQGYSHRTATDFDARAPPA